VTALLEWLALLAARAQAFWLRPRTLAFLAGVAGLVLVTVALEALSRRDVRRYAARPVVTDLLYTTFYLAGIYGFLVSGPLFGALNRLVDAHVPVVRLGLLRDWPAPVQFVVLTVVNDALAYWVHRWLHASPVLWAFHSIHHSQQVLTPLTNFRFHFLDTLLRSLAVFLPGLLLGPSPGVWLAAGLVVLWLQLLAHSELDWHFGPLERVLVSPRFHSVHHSVDPAASGRNFGFVFSVWDFLFGTAVTGPRRAAAYGVAGLRVPESFVRQLAFPFAHVARRLARPVVRRAP
jgi:sterol desaturase/sphingolipid hydroxylase (fatty acid hydroxylase superfamily)